MESRLTPRSRPLRGLVPLVIALVLAGGLAARASGHAHRFGRDTRLERPGAQDASFIPIQSRFDTDDEGWTVEAGDGSHSGPPTYVANAGNPGGCICVDRQSSFVAPAKFLGDQSGAFGRLLTFDYSGRWALALSAGQTGPALLLGGVAESTDWTHYSFRLNARGLQDWSFVESTGQYRRPTDADVASILRSLNIVQVTNVNPATGCLDNFTLGGSGQMRVRPETLFFPRVRVGHHWTMQVIISNQSHTPGDVLTVHTAIVAPDPEVCDFRAGLRPGENIDIPPRSFLRTHVTFQPTAAGFHVATLAIFSTDPEDPRHNVLLHGRGFQH